MTIAAPTRPAHADRYAVLGNPVAHSRSPFIHQRFAEAAGQALVYERVLAPLDAFDATLDRFAAEGGRGCNITVPFKFDAFRRCSRPTERAALAGAANVIRFDTAQEGGWLADNTDGIGLCRDIEDNAGRALRGRRVLLVGAGGAGAGVLGPLLAAGPAQLQLVNRSSDKARALVARHAEWARRHQVDLQAGGLEEADQGFDVVINASASSLAAAGVPVADRVLRPGALAVDLMYGSAAAPFLDWAQRLGAEGRDGLGMLVEQAAEAFWLWRGVRPSTGPVLLALRDELARPQQVPA